MILRRPVLLVFVAAIIGAPVSIWPDGRTVSARERSTAATAATPVQQPVAEDVFDDTRLHDVRLFINSKDLAILRARYRENVNTPADIQIDGTRVRNVAVRSRGGGSRNPTEDGAPHRLQLLHGRTGGSAASKRSSSTTYGRTLPSFAKRSP